MRNRAERLRKDGVHATVVVQQPSVDLFGRQVLLGVAEFSGESGLERHWRGRRSSAVLTGIGRLVVIMEVGGGHGVSGCFSSGK